MCGTLPEIGLGTHIVRPNLLEILQYAISRGITVIDSAPNYGNGEAHSVIAKILKTLPQRTMAHADGLFLSSKVGFVPTATLQLLPTLLTALDTELLVSNHLLSPSFIRYQTAKTMAEFMDWPLQCLFLHNPEIQMRQFGKRRTEANLLNCFETCEELVAQKFIYSYGIATWDTLLDTFDVGDFIRLAKTVGGQSHNFRYLQLPISLVRCETAKNACYFGRGPLAAARRIGVSVVASSPLHGGELPKLVEPAFVQMFGPNLSPAQACLQFVRSIGFVDIILAGCSSMKHVDQLIEFRDQPPMSKRLLSEILSML